jgi:hypothetical protein
MLFFADPICDEAKVIERALFGNRAFVYLTTA